MQAPSFRAERGVGGEGAPALDPGRLECGRGSAPRLSRARMRLAGRAPPLRLLPSVPAGSRTLGSAGQRCPEPRKWPRPLGDSLAVREPVGLRLSCVSRGEVDTFVASRAWELGWGGRPVLRNSPGVPSAQGRGLSGREPTGSDTFPAASAAAVPRYGEKRAPGTSPGASGAPAPRGVCESPWEIPAPLPAPARRPPFLSAGRQR